MPCSRFRMLIQSINALVGHWLGAMVRLVSMAGRAAP